MYTTAFAMFMNKARFDSLPPDVKKVLIDTDRGSGILGFNLPRCREAR
jgi:hypothetical protein